jgi:hypothetical protein
MRYQPVPGGPTLVRAILLVLIIAAAAIIWSTIRNDRPPLVFTVLWLAALGWNVYWWSFRVAASLTIDDDDTLTWTPAGSRHRVPLSAIVRVRPSRLGPNVLVIELSERRPVLTIATKGVREFIAELQRRRPDLLIRLGAYSRLAERMPGPSRSRRR